MKQQPDKPSELIMLALGDLNACMNDPDYLINMKEWHLKLYALDKFCTRLVSEGLSDMGYGLYNLDRDIPEFDKDPEGFFMAMTEIANDLSEKGL